MIGTADRLLSSCASWDEFWERAKTLSTTEKGAAFERLTQLYLQTIPEYRAELEHVWTLREVPPAVRKLLALPVLDEGIDFIARTRHGSIGQSSQSFGAKATSHSPGRSLGPSRVWLSTHATTSPWLLSPILLQSRSANAT
jgi:hypothetical protein